MSQKISVGGKIGCNLSSLYGPDATEYTNPKIGWNMGGFIEYKISEFLFLSGEFNYSERGCSYEEITHVSNLTIIKKENFNYNYLEIPLLGKFSLGNRTKLFVTGGPCLGFLTSATRTGSEKTEKNVNMTVVLISKTTIDENIASEIYKFDLGYSFSVGFNIPREKNFNFIVEIRYTLGMTSTDKSSNKLELFNDFMTMNVGMMYTF
jgi:hypothetical protein